MTSEEIVEKIREQEDWFATKSEVDPRRIYLSYKDDCSFYFYIEDMKITDYGNTEESVRRTLQQIKAQKFLNSL
jgi:hypothetical protein